MFPEMWSDGYTLPQDKTKLRELVVSADGKFICAFRDLAKELQMAIGITFLECHEPTGSTRRIWADCLRLLFASLSSAMPPNHAVHFVGFHSALFLTIPVDFPMRNG